MSSAYIPSVVSDFFLGKLVPTAWRMIPSAGKKTSMFLDPVDVVTGLAITALYAKSGEEGIKLSILENRVRRDHNRGYLQSIKRAYDGTHHEQLSDLTAPIFYALKWFKPHENPRFSVIFRLAIEGIEALMKTYSKEENKFTVEYLHTAHLKLLEEGLTGKHINFKELRVPNWEKKPLAQRCFQLWQKDNFERLQQICTLFQTAIRGDSLELIENFPIKPLVEIIKQRVDEVVVDLLKYKKTLVSVDEDEDFLEDSDASFVTTSGGASSEASVAPAVSRQPLPPLPPTPLTSDSSHSSRRNSKESHFEEDDVTILSTDSFAFDDTSTCAKETCDAEWTEPVAPLQMSFKAEEGRACAESLDEADISSVITGKSLTEEKKDSSSVVPSDTKAVRRKKRR